MRSLFFGTPEIAVPALEELHRQSEIVGVVTQPDRPAGRGLELHAPAVKKRALELGLEVLQPTKVRTEEFAQWVASKNAQVALVLAYGRLLPPAVLQAPARGCLNLHASLLPKYRGASPITWAVVKGETETGITLMQMDATMDTGPIFSRHRLAVGAEETAGDLSVRLAELAAQVVREDLVRAVKGELQAVPQNEEEASYAPLLKKEQGVVDWGQEAAAIHNHVRGMSPWPGAFTRIRGKTLRILRTRSQGGSGPKAAPGSVLVADAGGLIVACGQGTIELLKVQLEGRKALGAREFVAGRGLLVGDKLE